jgi:WD40 repeat protein
MVFGSPVVFSPDGKQILAGGGTNSESTIKIFETERGLELHTFLTQVNTSASPKFSPDGQQIISTYHKEKRWGSIFHGDAINYLCLWDVGTGRLLRTFSGYHNDPIFDMAFSPDGKQIVSASADNTAKLWDVATGNELFTFRHPKSVFSVAFSPDGKRIITGSYDTDGNTTLLILWDATNGREIYTRRNQGGPASLAFSPDGRQIVSGKSTEAMLWDAAKGEVIRTFSTSQSLRFVAFSPDGTQIATADDATVKLWDIKNGNLLYTFDGGVPVAFSQDSKQLITRDSQHQRICVWDIENGQQLKEYEGSALAFSPDLKQFASNAICGIAIYETSTNKELSMSEKLCK